MQDGKALQSGTSHYLGQKLLQGDGDGVHRRGRRAQARLHDVVGGCPPRMMGAVVMTHGDDNGLRVPPRVAPPPRPRSSRSRGDDPTAVLDAAAALQAEIAAQSWSGAPVRAEVDLP